jgi:hypothetical protein
MNFTPTSITVETCTTNPAYLLLFFASMKTKHMAFTVTIFAATSISQSYVIALALHFLTAAEALHQKWPSLLFNFVCYIFDVLLF